MMTVLELSVRRNTVGGILNPTTIFLHIGKPRCESLRGNRWPAFVKKMTDSGEEHRT